MARRLAAIMFTDMVGYTALAQADEAAALALLEQHNQLLRPVFTRFGGREVKTVGDAFLVEFPSALDAAQSALEAQQVLHTHNKSTPDSARIRIRIGIHVGDVVESAGDVLGDAVNIASRIQALADPEGICITQQVYDQVARKLATPIVRLPQVPLKNVRTPVTVYKMVPTWGAETGRRSSPAPKEDRHLAVLPLANFSPDPTDEYFADGLTEELIMVLSHVGGLGVIARTSVAQYKAAPRPISQVGAELGVDTILEGSVRKAGSRVRITLQLIDVPTQRHIWANSYDRTIDDVFAVQSDIAERTAEALRLELARQPPRGRGEGPTDSAEAYDLYLRGLVLSSDIPVRKFREAFDCFERATQLDPRFAEAYAMWANLYVAVAGDEMPVREAMPRARELAQKAIALDDASSDAHAALANIALQFDLDWAVAGAEFERAIALNPSNTNAYRFYAMYLAAQARFDEAMNVYRRLIRLDPAGAHHAGLSWAQTDSGDFEGPIAAFRAHLADDPDDADARLILGFTYCIAGRRKEAAAELAHPLKDPPPNRRFDHALLAAMLGQGEEARSILTEHARGEWKGYLSPAYLAMLESNIGETELALDTLEQDFREGDRLLWLWNRSPAFDSIRDTPRYRRLLQLYGVPQDPPARGKPPPPDST